MARLSPDITTLTTIATPPKTGSIGVAWITTGRGCRCGPRAKLAFVLVIASNGSLQYRLRCSGCGVESMKSAARPRRPHRPRHHR